MKIPQENEGLFWNTFKHLINGGCPPEQAQRCAEIVATDQPGLPNLGRSPEDQQLIKSSVKYLVNNSVREDWLSTEQ